MRVLLTALAICCAVVAFANFLVPMAAGRSLPVSVFITHPLGMAGMGYLLFTWIFPRALRRGSEEEHAERVRSIEEHGGSLAAGRYSGLIGSASFREPLLKVTVYPTGVVIKPIFMHVLALALNEITAVRLERVFFRQAVTIHHSSALVRKPVVLYCNADDPVVRALRSLVGNE
jgi:hypothetical protein